MGWITLVKEHIKEMNEAYTSSLPKGFIRKEEQACFQRKINRLDDQEGRIVKSIVDGHITRSQVLDDNRSVDYTVHFQQLIKQNNKFFIEEKIENRRAIINDAVMTDDFQIINEQSLDDFSHEPLQRDFYEEDIRYSYSRMEAVRYAERWWNDYNPKFKKFENNCTNFISQCLYAGGAPMTGYPNRNKGWWYRNNNWSLSWAVAHSLRWYLSGAKTGLRAKEMAKPEQLLKGDVICYDFNGDGRWQHSTIVVEKDSNNMPLVNAQTTNSRMRYWAYEDSTAWTPNIKYKFFHIIDS